MLYLGAMNTNAFRCLALCLTLLCCAGCATTPAGGRSAIVVEIHQDGTGSVGGKRVEWNALPKEMRKQGAGPATGVRVEVPATLSTRQLTDVSRLLASSGFGKVVFSTPRKASTEVKEKKRWGR